MNLKAILILLRHYLHILLDSFCKESVPIIKDLGFKSSLSCTEGINYITDDSNCLFGLKRFNRSSRTSTSAFFKKIEIMLDK